MERGIEVNNNKEGEVRFEGEKFVHNLEELAESLEKLSKTISASSREDLKAKAAVAFEKYLEAAGDELRPIAVLFGEAGKKLLLLLGVDAETAESFTNDSDAHDFFELLGIPDGYAAWREVKKLLPVLNELLEGSPERVH